MAINAKLTKEEWVIIEDIIIKIAVARIKEIRFIPPEDKTHDKKLEELIRKEMKRNEKGRK